LRELFTAMGVIRAPLAVALIAFVIIYIPNQTGEVFVTEWEKEHRTVHLATVGLCLLLFCAALLILCVWLIDSATGYQRSAISKFSRAVDSTILVIATLPVIAVYGALELRAFNRTHIP
jgi:hypothetical protein